MLAAHAGARSAKILYIKGRQHPVQIMYAKEPQVDYVQAALATVVQIHKLLPPGDILVFLAGELPCLASIIVLLTRRWQGKTTLKRSNRFSNPSSRTYRPNSIQSVVPPHRRSARSTLPPADPRLPALRPPASRSAAAGVCHHASQDAQDHPGHQRGRNVDHDPRRPIRCRHRRRQAQAVLPGRLGRAAVGRANQQVVGPAAVRSRWS